MSKNKYYRIIWTIILFCICNATYSQDINFSQYNLVPLHSNVAMISMYNRPQIGLSYRLQYLGKPSTTSFNVRGYQSPVYLNALYPLIKKSNGNHWGSIGISFVNDQAGDVALLKTTGGTLAFAYNYTFNNDNHISLGTEVGFYQRTVNTENLLSGANWVNGGVDGTAPIGIEFQNINVTYPRINTGIMYYRTKSIKEEGSDCSYEKIKGFIGINAQNLNQPNTAFITQEDRLPIGFTAIGAYNFEIGISNSEVQPNFRYIQEGNTNQINAGIMYIYNLSNTFNVSGGLSYSTQGSMIVMAQVQHDKFFAGLSYDYGQMGNRQNLGGGALEITAGMKFGKSCTKEPEPPLPLIDSLVPVTKVDSVQLETGDIILKTVTSTDTLKIDPTSGKIKDRIAGELTVDVDTILSRAPTFKELKILEKKVYFHYISYGLNKSGEGLLDEITDFLTMFPKEKLVIQGHSCNIQKDPVKNKVLSVNRAKAVQDYLIQKGINPARLQIEGHGDEEPILSNETEYGRIKNRRVEFKRIPGTY